MGSYSIYQTKPPEPPAGWTMTKTKVIDRAGKKYFVARFKREGQPTAILDVDWALAHMPDRLAIEFAAFEEAARAG